MKHIYITESQLDVIREFENKKVLNDDFEKKVRAYMEQLRTNPCHPKYDEFFKDHNIPEKELQNKMIDLGLIKMVDKIDEPKNANGEKQSMHSRKFIFSGANFDDNIEKLYDSFFNNGERKLNECDCGGVMGGGACAGDTTAPGGATTTDSTGNYQYTVPVFGIQRRGIGVDRSKKKKKKDPSLSRPKGKIAINRK